MTTKQRQAVFGAVVQQIPPAPVDGDQLQSEIHTFSQASLVGAYYAPFNIHSQNFSDIPEETDAWFTYRPRPSRTADTAECCYPLHC